MAPAYPDPRRDSATAGLRTPGGATIVVIDHVRTTDLQLKGLLGTRMIKATMGSRLLPCMSERRIVMPRYNPAMQKARLNALAPDSHGKISKRTADLDGVSVTQVTFDVGARWATDLKDYAGTDSCVLPHVAFVLSGTLHIVMDDGSEDDFSAGDVMLLPPGHDAWTVGNEACTFVEFSRGNDYYAT